MDTKLKIGDYLYKMVYYTHPLLPNQRSISKRKIQKISHNRARFTGGESVKLSSIDNDTIDEWYSSRKLMYNGKLKAHLKENENVLREIEYLKNKVTD